MTPPVVASARPRELLARNWDGFLRVPARQHRIAGGGGCGLNVMDFGPLEAPPLLFIHGWSQSWMCWMKQIEGLSDRFRVVCLDSRGQGDSDKPFGDEHYNDSALWADDVDAVIHGLKLQKPVLNGWSYGGLVLGDYLALRGTDDIAGVHFIGAAVINGGRLPFFGPALLRRVPKMSQPNAAIAIEHARKFVRECTAVPSQREVFETALAWTMQTPAHVRLSLVKRKLDFRPTLATLKIPVMVSQGLLDQVILPAMADEIVKAAPHAIHSRYDRIGHMPFLEDPERFNRELAGFASGL
ncbi:alpha/beta hydrolase [Terrarubrum flagellatum]|uniref:alpha/beta fold hydrolase n=1 Tax=Terrirubrum flagellatum TaxID=2895980 RepID=UPI003144EECC